MYSNCERKQSTSSSTQILKKKQLQPLKMKHTAQLCCSSVTPIVYIKHSIHFKIGVLSSFSGYGLVSAECVWNQQIYQEFETDFLLETNTVSELYSVICNLVLNWS